jgi:hypothetical protein
MTLTTIRSTIRGGGSGGGAWVAKITGTDPKFGYAREFIRKNPQLSGSGRSGYIDFPIVDPGVYEIRNVQLEKGEASIGNLWSAFIQVTPDGSYEEVNKSNILSLIGN